MTETKRSFYPPPKSRRESPKSPTLQRHESAPNLSRRRRWEAEKAEKVEKVAKVEKVEMGLRRESSCSISSSEWAGGLRSRASENSSNGSGSSIKGKGKGKGKRPLHQDSESDSEIVELSAVVTTSLEVPLRVLRSSWKAPVAEASTARIEVDASRRDGFGRITIVGSWRQSFLAYQCLMELFHRASNHASQSFNAKPGPRVWRGKAQQS
ncbi:Endo/exonuclease/phosphatase domain-containing protein [Durusdinium trenchii]|uniref:Endo/exonuclease/phosphatase domain-containing protein n=1 Tax=Durusdinium trenchii TaxID=1381693 RepID=A0ABP0LCR0_9DINO